MQKIKFICRTCKSDNVSLDAFVDWNQEKQEWMDVRAVYQEATCHDCGESTKLDEVVLDDKSPL